MNLGINKQNFNLHGNNMKSSRVAFGEVYSMNRQQLAQKASPTDLPYSRLTGFSVAQNPPQVVAVQTTTDVKPTSPPFDNQFVAFYPFDQ